MTSYSSHSLPLSLLSHTLYSIINFLSHKKMQSTLHVFLLFPFLSFLLCSLTLLPLALHGDKSIRKPSKGSVFNTMLHEGNSARLIYFFSLNFIIGSHRFGAARCLGSALRNETTDDLLWNIPLLC